MVELLVGADPELFVKDPSGKIISAWGLIPGTKEDPHKVDKGMVQVDGCALEFGIDPANSEEEFVHNTDTVLKTLRAMVPKKFLFEIEPWAAIDLDNYSTLPKEAKELGCDPDYSAYSAIHYANPRPIEQSLKNNRTAAGHIHIGWTKDVEDGDFRHLDACKQAVKAMDCTVGLANVLWHHYKGTTSNFFCRRAFYGQAGAFRPKPYGVEYRTPCNFWLKDRKLMAGVYNSTIRTVNKIINANGFDNWIHSIHASNHLYDGRYYGKSVRSILNYGKNGSIDDIECKLRLFDPQLLELIKEFK